MAPRDSDAPASPTAQSPPPPDADQKICPDCGEPVRRIARKCRFCGYRFTADPTDASQVSA